MVNEASLKGDLVRELRASLPGAVVLRHEDKITSGIPDISVTLGRVTTWLEVKLAAPSFSSKGIQALTCRRLARQGSCLYVIYGPGEQTTVCHPEHLERWERLPSRVAVVSHAFVTRVLRAVHKTGQP